MYALLISLLMLQSEPVRKPVPSLEELRPATKQLNETYQDLAKVKKSSKFPEDRIQLAKELLKQGVENTVSDAEAYVLLDEAMALFKSAGDISNSLSCINELSKRFEIDSLTLKIETVIDVAKTTSDFRMSFDTAIEVAKIAQEEGKFDKVAPLLQVAQTAATKLGDKKLTLLVSAIKKDAANLKKENDAYLKAVKILEMTPEDAVSNAAVGRYWCFIRGDWSKGPEYILKGNDLASKVVVQKELDGPKDLREMSALADTWWDLPGSGQIQVRHQREACYWYEIVAQYGAGLAKVTAEKRLQMTSGRSPRRPVKPGLIQLGYLDKELKKLGPNQIVPSLNLNFDASAASMGLPGDNFSLIWTGYLSVPETGSYTLSFYTDDGGKLWIDDEIVFDQWAFGQHRHSATRQLTAGLHRFRAQYVEFGGNAGIGLSWKRLEPELVPVPATAFFHDPNVALAVGAK